MISIYEYACLSKDVYSSPSTHNSDLHRLSKQDLENFLKKLPKKVQGWYRITDIDDKTSPESPCYSQLYLKFNQGDLSDAVVAVRGTVPQYVDNDWQDIHSFASEVMGDGGHDHVPVYVHRAHHFYLAAKDYLRKHFKKLQPVHLTGHSLGGAVVKLLALRGVVGVPVVAFNAPGCARMPEIHAQMAVLIHNINARYDFVSKVGLTLGQLQLIDVPNEEALARKFFEHFDEKAYQQSVAHFTAAQKSQGVEQLTDALAGLGFRFYAYLAALDIEAAHHTAEQSEALKAAECATDLIRFWTSAQVVLIKQAIDMGVFGSALMAQHSMNNMVNALLLPENIDVGHRVIA